MKIEFTIAYKIWKQNSSMHIMKTQFTAFLIMVGFAISLLPSSGVDSKGETVLDKDSRRQVRYNQQKNNFSMALIVYFIDSWSRKVAVRSLKILKLVSKVGGDRARQSSWSQFIFLGSAWGDCYQVIDTHPYTTFTFPMIAELEHIWLDRLKCRPMAAPAAPARGGGAFALGRGAAFMPSRSSDQQASISVHHIITHIHCIHCWKQLDIIFHPLQASFFSASAANYLFASAVATGTNYLVLFLL